MCWWQPLFNANPSVIGFGLFAFGFLTFPWILIDGESMFAFRIACTSKKLAFTFPFTGNHWQATFLTFMFRHQVGPILKPLLEITLPALDPMHSLGPGERANIAIWESHKPIKVLETAVYEFV